jgi:hypothetical protein
MTMGYFRDFCGKSDKERRFLVIVDRFGGLGVARLDDKGEVGEWAFARPACEGMQYMLREVWPHATVHRNDDDIKGSSAYTCESVDELLAVMNGKPGIKKARMEMLYYHTGRLRKFIKYDQDAGKYVARVDPIT